jgi:hypothetical protein
MQDLWITGGNANTTLPVSAGWQTCSGYDLNLALPVQYHFIVYQDDVFNTAGHGFIFQEQCDTIDQNVWFVNHEANKTALPPLEQQATIDAMGGIATHALAALPAMGAQAGGTPGANGVGGTYTYAYRVWVGGGTETSGTITISQCLPLPGFVNNPCFQNLLVSYSEGTTHVQIFRESSTDTVATAGLIDDVVFTSPQHAGSVNNGFGFEDTRIAPISSNVIGTGNYSANTTGSVAWKCGTIPAASAYPGVIGQTCLDPAGGFVYYSDADDHWKRAPLTFANF